MVPKQDHNGVLKVNFPNIYLYLRQSLPLADTYTQDFKEPDCTPWRAEQELCWEHSLSWEHSLCWHPLLTSSHEGTERDAARCAQRFGEKEELDTSKGQKIH